MLISGKKFDLRLYVLVTSFHPLKAYLFKFGFCRFCSVKYNAHLTDINCLFAHLTNVSVQKEGNDAIYFINLIILIYYVYGYFKTNSDEQFMQYVYNIYIY